MGNRTSSEGHPPFPQGESHSPQESAEARASQRQALALPAPPPPRAAQTTASKFQRQRSVGPEAEGCLLHLRGGHSSSSALGCSHGPTAGLPGRAGGQTGRRGLAQPTSSFLSAACDTAGQSGGRHSAGRGCGDTSAIWKGKSPTTLHRFLIVPLCAEAALLSYSPS